MKETVIGLSYSMDGVLEKFVILVVEFLGKHLLCKTEIRMRGGWGKRLK